MNSVTAGALTAVIGYLGAEVADDSLLERLLWPERFNHQTHPGTLVQRASLMTIGGPLHKAALQTLENFRAQGLFAGPCRGHMLGTMFFSDVKIAHFQRCKNERMFIPEKSRNGFWVRVLRNTNIDRLTSFTVPRQDTESRLLGDGYRSLQPVYHLKLGVIRNEQKPGPNEVCVSEDRITATITLNCCLSEIVSVICSLIAGLTFGSKLFGLYLILPLLLKLLLLVFSVRRVGLMSQQDLQKVAEKEHTTMAIPEAFEVGDPIHKYMVIEGPQPLVVQFFRHYGHPRRDRNSLWIGDRIREIACMLFVCCLSLYFPVGLLVSHYSEGTAQYIWIGYQLYATLAMHIVRIFGWQDIGTTERTIASLLSKGKTVWLTSETGCTVSASLVLHSVTKAQEGKDKIEEIINQCKTRLRQGGGDLSRLYM